MGYSGFLINVYKTRNNAGAKVPRYNLVLVWKNECFKNRLVAFLLINPLLTGVSISH